MKLTEGFLLIILIAATVWGVGYALDKEMEGSRNYNTICTITSK